TSTREMAVVANASPHWVLSIAYSPDGRKVAWTSDNNNTLRGRTVHILDLTTDHQTVVRAPTGNVNDLAFSPDSGKLAWATDDNNVQLWDLTQPHPVTLVPAVRNHTVKSIAFSPNGRTIAFGDDNA